MADAWDTYSYESAAPAYTLAGRGIRLVAVLINAAL